MKHKRDDGVEKQDEETVDVTPIMICVFVVMCCNMLVLLYFFYDYLGERPTRLADDAPLQICVERLQINLQLVSVFAAATFWSAFRTRDPFPFLLCVQLSGSSGSSASPRRSASTAACGLL